METISTSPSFNLLFDKTILICNNDDHYATYSSREKMLAFVFTFLQQLNENEPDFKLLIEKNRFTFLKPIQVSLANYFDDLVFASTNSGEIQARPILANYYTFVLLSAFKSVIYFWSNDKSEYKEKTDVMVEKTVHFAFDLLAPNAIDSGLDLIQNLIKLR
jgi:hypothetical protein